MGILRKKYCGCGSGLEAGFCSHKGATATGTTSNGKRTSGGSKLVRQAQKKGKR